MSAALASADFQRAYLPLVRAGLATLLLLGAWLGPWHSAEAQDGVGQIRDLYRQGIEQYDFFEYDEAEKLFTQAIELASQKKIIDPIVAKVYVARGILFHTKLKGTAPQVAAQRARDEFTAAVYIDKTVSIDENYRTPELEEILEEVRKTVGSGGTGTGVKPPPGADDIQITHNAVKLVDDGKPLVVKATVQEHPDVFSVRIKYRAGPSAPFSSLDMVPSTATPSVYSATIPPENITAKPFFYYIEVLDRQRNIRATSGTPAKPFQVTIMGNVGGGGGSQASGDMPIMSLFLGAGLGFGFVEGESENISGENPNISFGAARTSFYVATDAMFYLIDRIQLGIYGRFQTEQNLESFMIGARLRYHILDTGSHRVYTGVAIGGGFVKYLINLGPDFNNADEVASRGPVHIAPNVGYMVAFHENVGLQIDVMIPIHFPDFTFHFDVTFGPYVQF